MQRDRHETVLQPSLVHTNIFMKKCKKPMTQNKQLARLFYLIRIFVKLFETLNITLNKTSNNEAVAKPECP